MELSIRKNSPSLQIQNSPPISAMSSSALFILWIPFTILFSTLASATSIQSHDYETRFYSQTLDHFSYGPLSFSTFKQRYVIVDKYWGGAKATAPILAYLGAESDLDNDPNGVGFIEDNAERFNALIVFIEHRYYGKSFPFSSREEAMSNASTMSYFNSAQALADYAEILVHIKKQLMAEYSPLIVVGGSYGGMLACWFRLKFPHIALGALASSAPILYGFVPTDAGYAVVEKDFKDTSETCYTTIRDLWAEIDKLASQPNGLSLLSQRFRACSPLDDEWTLKQYLMHIYYTAAQYDNPHKHLVANICNGIDRGSEGTDVISRAFACVIEYRGNQSCYPITSSFNAASSTFEPDPSETIEGWSWQSCTDFLHPEGVEFNSNVTMFQPKPVNWTSAINQCRKMYGVVPRRHWVPIYYGGNDIRMNLRRFGSNIIFSNGLQDPISSGGVLENISKTIVALKTAKGSHCLDLFHAKTDDPSWLVKQRNTEVKIIEKWIVKYHKDLAKLKM